MNKAKKLKCKVCGMVHIYYENIWTSTCRRHLDSYLNVDDIRYCNGELELVQANSLAPINEDNATNQEADSVVD